MRGLLYKDTYILMKKARFFIGMIIIFSFFPGYSMSVFAIMYATMLPITALAYDEHSHWNQFALMLPYSPKQIVISKYILGYICTASIGVLTFAGKCIIAIIQQEETFSIQENFIQITAVSMAACVLLAINLPLMFRFGVERGRMLFLIITVCGVVAFTAFQEEILQSLVKIEKMWGGITGMSVVGILIVVFINFLSILLAKRYFQQK